MSNMLVIINKYPILFERIPTIIKAAVYIDIRKQQLKAWQQILKELLSGNTTKQLEEEYAESKRLKQRYEYALRKWKKANGIE